MLCYNALVGSVKLVDTVTQRFPTISAEEGIMQISKIDARLSASAVKETDAVWRSVLDAPFSVHGVRYDASVGRFLRMPKEDAARVSASVLGLNERTSGGRVRFRTDSPYVSVYCVAPAFDPMPHMPVTGSHGFSVYSGGAFAGKITPSVSEVISPENDRIHFGGSVRLGDNGWRDIEIYMPLYGGVCELYIGVQDGASLDEPKEYKYKKPIVIYGSSITQGACASRPGNDFAMRLSRLLDADVLNLGFSGNGNAEPEMLDYLTRIDASAYIFDYNYYSDRPDRILPPHYEVYATLRRAHPKTPILMIDKPSYVFAGKDYEIRSKMIRDTYERAIRDGDGCVAMMDAKDLFGETEPDACVVDTDHPNDLGFYRMAESIFPRLKKLLELE